LQAQKQLNTTSGSNASAANQFVGMALSHVDSILKQQK
jgi:hypothetical protein